MQATLTLPHQIVGDFTSHRAIEVKNLFTNLIDQEDTNLTLDFTKVNEVDVVGINTLAMIYKQLRSRNGILTILLKKDSHLSKMLHLTKFDKIFTIVYP